MKYFEPLIMAVLLASCGEAEPSALEQYETEESAAIQRLKSNSGGGTAVDIDRLGYNPRSADWSRALVKQGPKILLVSVMDISEEGGQDYVTMEASPTGEILGARLTLRLTVPSPLKMELNELERGQGLILSRLVASVTIDEVQSQLVGDGDSGIKATSVALGSLNGFQKIERTAP